MTTKVVERKIIVICLTKTNFTSIVCEWTACVHFLLWMEKKVFFFSKYRPPFKNRLKSGGVQREPLLCAYDEYELEMWKVHCDYLSNWRWRQTNRSPMPLNCCCCRRYLLLLLDSSDRNYAFFHVIYIRIVATHTVVEHNRMLSSSSSSVLPLLSLSSIIFAHHSKCNKLFLHNSTTHQMLTVSLNARFNINYLAFTHK